MKHWLLLLACVATFSLHAQQFTGSKKVNNNSLEIGKPNGTLDRYAPKQDSLFLSKLLKRVKVGGLLHFVGVGLQDRPTAAEEAAPDFSRNWDKQFNVYRARILVGVELTKKTNFFIETEIPSIIGRGDNNGGKTIQVSPVILDAQVEHIFADEFSLIAGLQLVGITRNQLQSAASLLPVDFGYFQYPYNLFENQPLQNSFGRDVGVNARGFFANDKLEYRLGVFGGRNFDNDDPFRVVGRLNYNFLEAEKDLYYTGTSLGTKKIFALGGGIDFQSSYRSIGFDTFLDLPVGDNGAFTLNGAYTMTTGGTSSSATSFAQLIPKQTIHFLELGYYFKSVKLMPFFKYENQLIDAENEQNAPIVLENRTVMLPKDDFNTFYSNRRIGGGIGYFFHDYNANIKLSYESRQYGRETLAGGTAENQTAGEVWLQLQFFIF
jgi:hypothetical protein